MKNTRKLRAIIVVLSLVLIVLIIVAVCLGSKGNSGDDQDAHLNVIKTPYCSLKYPTQWGEQMAVEELKTNDATSYVFYAQIEGKRYDLFAVHFGNPAPGDLFGYLPNNGSEIPVYVDCYSIPDRSELSESELSLVLSMMEGVNAVTQSIESAPGYEKPL